MHQSGNFGFLWQSFHICYHQYFWHPSLIFCHCMEVIGAKKTWFWSKFGQNCCIFCPSSTYFPFSDIYWHQDICAHSTECLHWQCWHEFYRLFLATMVDTPPRKSDYSSLMLWKLAIVKRSDRGGGGEILYSCNFMIKIWPLLLTVQLCFESFCIFLPKTPAPAMVRFAACRR